MASTATKRGMKLTPAAPKKSIIAFIVALSILASWTGYVKTVAGCWTRGCLVGDKVVPIEGVFPELGGPGPGKQRSGQNKWVKGSVDNQRCQQGADCRLR